MLNESISKQYIEIKFTNYINKVPHMLLHKIMNYVNSSYRFNIEIVNEYIK